MRSSLTNSRVYSWFRMRERTIWKLSMLWFIIFLGLFLRCYHLGFQSLWLDELYTAIECDSSIREHGLNFYLKHIDQQPPLFFLLEGFSVWLFHNHEWSLRLVPALAGTAGIGAIYLLGKEIKNSRLGLYSAALLSVNYFSIYYSQEARPYSLVLLFSILSMLFLLRCIRNPVTPNWALYCISTILMLYSNYFGILVVLVQVILSGIIVFSERKRDKKFLFQLILTAGIIAIGVLPLLKYTAALKDIKQFWAALPGEHIAIDYFFGFFGNSDLLTPLLLLFLISFFIQSFALYKTETGKLSYKPQTYLFTISFFWISISLLVPFFRSYLVVPMMVERYSITVLPAFILLLASGLELIQSSLVRRLLLFLFLVLSTTSLILVKQYYTRINKTQFREMAAYIAADSHFSFPILTENTAWQQTYYLKKQQYRSPVLNATFPSVQTDSLLQLPMFKNGFWLTRDHRSIQVDKHFPFRDSSFILLKEEHFFDCSAYLFVSGNFGGSGSIVIFPKDLPIEKRFNSEAEDLIPIWDGEPLDLPSKNLKAGRYKLLLTGKGSPLAGVYPHLHCSINGQEVGTYFMNQYETIKSFHFELSQDTLVRLRLRMDNDSNNAISHEDRNCLIHAILFIPDPH